ncbi:TIR-like protein FxsC [Streptomyces sp. NPDC005408]|uniref:TIR-like protein FxsC n=1 Tax=Streptomyces sp. NPDC005408 TaxID=3155341 RepID=UPI0033B9F04B
MSGVRPSGYHLRCVGTGGALEYPYFFLSYARLDDRTAYVRKFYEDLLDVLELPGTGSRRQPAFRDSESLHLGADWLRGLSRAVGSCRTLVALYSPAYFRSEYCGKEWSAFADRVSRYQEETDVEPHALVPVIWEPVSARLLPQEVKAVQYAESAMGRTYLEHGLLHLMRSDPKSDEYWQVVRSIAKRVRFAADHFALPSMRNSFDLSAVKGCFPVTLAQASSGHVRIFVAAGTIDRLPPGRSRNYYGEQPWLWNPYSPPAIPTAAHRAQKVVIAEGHLTSLEVVDTQLTRKLNQAMRLNQVSILLVDAWSARIHPYRKPLGTYDKQYHPTTAVLIPCHDSDDESGPDNAALWEDLKQLFTRNWLRRNNPHDPVFWIRVSQREFDDLVARIVTVTQNRIAENGHVRRLPPGGPPPPMPCL